jgi:hypothetical protein
MQKLVLGKKERGGDLGRRKKERKRVQEYAENAQKMHSK